GIGAALAARAGACRMDVRWWGRSPKPEAPWIREESLLDLARWAGVLAVCVKATDETRGLITREIIEAVGPDGLLVNVSRGQVVDEDALIAALKSGKLGAAALDVFWQEPTPPERWADVPNIILTPHMAGATQEAVQGMVTQVIGNVGAYLSGQPLLSPVQ
ncbi:MAG: NAD(P)-dependent oxidoreductase, partial [Caulobacteraceae bacterium]